MKFAVANKFFLTGLAIIMLSSRVRLVEGFLPALRIQVGYNHGTLPAATTFSRRFQSTHLLWGAVANHFPTGLASLNRWNKNQYDRRPKKRFLSSLFQSAVDEDEAVNTTKTVDSNWNLPALKKEVQRLVLRSHKKVGKAAQRLQQAKATVEELATNPDAALQELEACPNIEALEMDLKELKERLQGLNALEESLSSIKGKSGVVLPLDVAQLALDLGVDDQPPARPQRGPAKKKGPRRMAKRLPYRRYYTADKVEIRVGKQAEDNDELSLSPEHRDGSDWWMHASGCPGSHVVIRSGDATLPQDVLLDAAALAARQSKCQGNTIKVSLTRCRDVKKPMGAKAGLVQLVGNVRTVTVNMQEAQARLDRLDQTVVIN